MDGNVILLYETTVVCTLLTNKPHTVDEILEICDVNMDSFAADRGWESWNPEELRTMRTHHLCEFKTPKGSEVMIDVISDSPNTGGCKEAFLGSVIINSELMAENQEIEVVAMPDTDTYYVYLTFHRGGRKISVDINGDCEDFVRTALKYGFLNNPSCILYREANAYGKRRDMVNKIKNVDFEGTL